MIKKIVRIALFTISVIVTSFYTYSASFPYDSSNDIKPNKDTLNDIASSYGVGDSTSQSTPIVYYISKVINYFLAILAFVAVIVLLYGFSLVFTDKTDEGIKKGMKYVKIATIAIIVIGISWLFSMWIFSIYNSGG